MNKSELVFFAGKMGAGKSTYAQSLVNKGYIVISEDQWLQSLYPNDVKDMKDYLNYSRRIKETVKPLILDLLRNGVKVCLDFPGNTITQREWFKSIINESETDHRLIYLEASDDVCIKRIKQRVKSQPERAKFDNEEVFKQVTKYFEEPNMSEGLKIEIINQGESDE